MPVIAIIGAGQGVGLAIAKVFGARGFKTALLSRTPSHLESALSELAQQGIEAAAFHADVTDRASLGAGLAAVADRFGAIDVLEYSPSTASLPMGRAAGLTADAAQDWVNFQLLGAIAATGEVLPDMVQRGSGTIIVTTGASSIYPEMGHSAFAGATVAMGALRAWAHTLHADVATHGVQVAHVAIGVFIGQSPETSADKIAPLYWDLYNNRDEVEKIFTAGQTE